MGDRILENPRRCVSPPSGATAAPVCVSCGSGWSVPCVSIQLTLSQKKTRGARQPVTRTGGSRDTHTGHTGAHEHTDNQYTNGHAHFVSRRAKGAPQLRKAKVGAPRRAKRCPREPRRAKEIKSARRQLRKCGPFFCSTAGTVGNILQYLMRRNILRN